MTNIATIACYGRKGSVEFIQAVVHEEESGKIVCHKLWSAEDALSEGEVADEVIRFCREHDVKRIYQVDELLELEKEKCPHCGALALRKALVYP